MKFATPILCFAALCSHVAAGDEALAQKLLDLTRFNEGLDQRLSNAYPKLKEPTERSKAFWTKLRTERAKLYAKRFSDEQLSALIAFFQTPAGKEFAKEQPAVEREMNEVGSNLLGDFISGK